MATLDYKNSLGRYRRYLANMQSQPLWNVSFWVSLTLVLVIVMVAFFLRPTLVIISGLMGQVREQKALLVKMDQKIEILKQAQESMNQAKDGKNTLDQVLPEQPAWKELGLTLYQIASDSGVIINKVEVGNTVLSGTKIEDAKNKTGQTEDKTKLPKGAEKITFLLDVNGEYKQIKEILQRIEKLGRIMVIENARVSKNKDGSLGLGVSGFATFFKYEKEETK